jgi:hypothetical protein
MPQSQHTDDEDTFCRLSIAATDRPEVWTEALVAEVAFWSPIEPAVSREAKVSVNLFLVFIH